MKRINLIFLVFPLIWACCFFFMRGHLQHWEETGFFMGTWEYSLRFWLKPGGWTEYLGHFLLQFFRWPWLGALIVTLILGGVFAATRAVARSLNFSDDLLIPACIPLLLTGGLVCRGIFPLSEVVRVLLFFVFLAGFLHISRPGLRPVVLILLFPCIYLLFSWGGCLLLYLTVVLVELRKEWGKKCIWLLPAGVGLAFIWPWIWRRFAWFAPGEALYTATVLEGWDACMWGVIYGYGLLLWGTSILLKPVSLKGGRRVWMVNLVVAVLALAGCWALSWQKGNEYFYRMDQAVQAGNWKEVLKIAGKLEQTDREELYFISLALAAQGELPERIFEYPVWGSGCLYLPRQLEYKSSMLGGELYYRLKVPNEAIHWIFQASVASPQGMDFRALKRLIDLNIQIRDIPVARKYLSILEKAVCYVSWCRDRRSRMTDPAAEYVPPQEENDFFIGGRPFLSDMARLLDAGKSKEMILDYILCGLLLDKDLQKFCRLFTAFYPYRPGQHLPRAYEEALLVANTLGWKEVCEKAYSFSEQNVRRYQEFNMLFKTCGKNKEQGREIMTGYRGTWWYYFHFVELKPMDPRGNMLNGYSS